MFRNNGSKVILTVLVIILVASLAACNSAATPTPTEEMKMDEGMKTEGMEMDMSGVPMVPAGMAYSEGEEIRFIHTEASDADVAKLLSDMMSSPVLHVPSLAKSMDDMLAIAYVFKNGEKGMGPLGFQPDVFDNPPGSEGYTPLRKLVFVTWNDEGKARLLKSETEVVQAEQNGEVTLEVSGVVVNMPFITWPGGQR